MIITISGTAGSGKSTTGKKLAEHFGYEHFSMGDLQRKLAKQRGLTITEWGELEKKDPKYDRMIDDEQVRLGREKDNFILDSWLAPKFVPNGINIFLDGDIDVRVQRRLGHKRDEEHFSDFDDAKKDMLEREKINLDRWIEFYDYDYTDKSNFDIVIDTTSLDIEGVFNKVLSEIDKVNS